MNDTKGFYVSCEKWRLWSEESLDFWLRWEFDFHFWPARIQVEKGTEDFRPKLFFLGIMCAELRPLLVNSTQLPPVL